ncbi:LpxL/LpxP family acyltransferase [Pelagibaculum spongiae]|uniref:Lipid A biosynthesis lauroyl acyltransferase n=1 Tax=Pelagibaculum spongiae TaxID=2080658 RepID=A0A2V1GUL6_9GAMM|nr:lipid A biosynthesis lauroyl acyltransferase [Pelagibaculum spongiae]PVZ66367.1 lipid A biosynthesis lauroyl acyltransferase [Pelagibaculum spongiae]
MSQEKPESLENQAQQKTYTSDYHFQWKFLHPKYLGLWLLVLILFILGRLPLPAFFATGRAMGRLLMKLGGSRLRVTRQNLALCFPEKTDQQREQLLKQNFETLGIALLEPGLAWFASRSRIQRLGRFEIDPELQTHLEQGKPILLSALHMTCLEMACRIASENMPFNLLYRPNNNPLFEYLSGKFRQRPKFKTRFIPRKQVKDLLHFMQHDEPGMILPDQDFGPKRSVFMPFFGVNTATVMSTSDFARQTFASVAIVTIYLEKTGYVVKFSAPLKNFPSDDSFADTLRLNQLTEQRILEHPEQYLWQHRRFKTRPEGESSLYQK